jgi:hypothetical protein
MQEQERGFTRPARALSPMISNYRFQNSNQQALSGICGGQISDFKRAALGGNVK